MQSQGNVRRSSDSCDSDSVELATSCLRPRCLIFTVVAIGSITSRCSGNEPTLTFGRKTEPEGAAEIETIVGSAFTTPTPSLVKISLKGILSQSRQFYCFLVKTVVKLRPRTFVQNKKHFCNNKRKVSRDSPRENKPVIFFWRYSHSQ